MNPTTSAWRRPFAPYTEEVNTVAKIQVDDLNYINEGLLPLPPHPQLAKQVVEKFKSWICDPQKTVRVFLSVTGSSKYIGYANLETNEPKPMKVNHRYFYQIKLIALGSVSIASLQGKTNESVAIREAQYGHCLTKEIGTNLIKGLETNPQTFQQITDSIKARTALRKQQKSPVSEEETDETVSRAQDRDTLLEEAARLEAIANSCLLRAQELREKAMPSLSASCSPLQRAVFAKEFIPQTNSCFSDAFSFQEFLGLL